MLNRELNDKESLILSVKQHYTNLGVATKIVRSKDGKVWIGCDRGGSNRNYHGLTDETRRRQPSSRLVGCEFRVVGRRVCGDNWKIVEVIDIHNHEISSVMNGHPSSRRLKEIQKNKVRRKLLPL
jgi:hypothetical protein